MGTMSKLINLLLIERNMSKKELAEKIGTTPSNISGKLRRDNFSEKELQDIAKVCDATFQGIFILNETGKEIK
ncbi:helix-turn-helix transcriptional regulator [Butyricicoccus faecihominis]|uniref:helix-turn-helix domain-containing protein n=1 Tax=Butyricicoccus faecihominis TaxID=1712515 RepID=UPI0024795A3B|nr:helix-turn-helix transcriptional regulator [Butyricicoccus faecihominis]MCQ5130993.1 helix-turn-helix transcriptional regulator [Butyricicoccus faecihominis]